MGVNLREIAAQKEIDMESLGGSIIAVDALNTIFQFLSIIRDRLTGEPLKDSQGRVTSHISGLFYRTARMLEAGVTPVYVFDGKAPEFKRGLQAERRKAREEAKEKWMHAVREGDAEKVRLYSQQVSEVNDEMLNEAKKLLDAMGVQWMLAPSEGEAEAAYLNKKGTVYACSSQDWDSLLFGATRLVRNLAVTGKRKLPGKETYITVRPEMIQLDAVLDNLGISHDQLIMIGILTGTDYNPGGVKGFGPKKALELVKEHKTLDAVKRKIEWGFETPIDDIFDFFRNPPARELQIERRRPDPERIREILVEEHSFSPERIDNTMAKLEAAAETKKQSSLGRFL